MNRRPMQWQRPGGEIFRGPTFLLNEVFSGKNCIFMAKSSDDLFSHPAGFSDFSFLFPHFPYLCYVKCRIPSFPHNKKHLFYFVHTFARIRQHYFSKYWGTSAWADPHLKFLGDRLPQSPLGLRLWLHTSPSQSSFPVDYGLLQG